MSSTMRSVDTRFWSDTWIRKLNALDRYAFLYFLTNEHSSWCGVYEVDLSMVAFESGIDEHDLRRSILPRLHPKVIYLDGWVYVKNFEKYHANRSEQTKKGIENAWNEVPEEIRLKIKELEKKEIHPRGGIEGVSSSSLSLSFSSSLSSAPTVVSSLPFEDFWIPYPKKVEKLKTEKIWKTMSYDKQKAAIDDIPRRKLGKQWKEGFIPNPTTYLSGERWNDEIVPVKSNSKTIK